MKQAFAMCVVLVVFGMALVLSLQANDRKDIVFLRDPACKGDTVQCARQLYFNGDWKGTQLCREHTCVAFEEVFREERH